MWQTVSPGAKEQVHVNGGINRKYIGTRGMRVREIMYSSILAWLAWLGDPRERRRLEGTNKGLDLSSRAWADVTALLEFARDHFLVGLRVQEEGWTIRGGRGNVNRPYTGVETVE